jgi:hypothetical protein
MGYNMTRPKPPRSATWVLHCLLPDEDKDAIIGDLIEEHALLQSQSGRGAALWYWGQVGRSIPPLLSAAARRERWHAILGAAIVAYILATLIESVFTVAIQKLFVRDTFVPVLLTLIAGLAAMAAGGYVAAWMRRGAAVALAILIALVVATLMMTMAGSVPGWYAVGFLILGPLASLAGGALLRRAS